MDSTKNRFTWLEDAFAKDVVDDLEAACCLTDGQCEVYFSNKISRTEAEYGLSPKLRANYEVINTWKLTGLPLFSYFDKALERSLPNLRWFTLVNKCKEFLLNLTEERQADYLKKYPNIGSKLDDLLKERRRFSRGEYTHVPEDMTRLTVKYSLEQVQRILEEAEKGNFLMFAKVFWKDCTESFLSLTPPEVTAVRNNHPNKTSVIIGYFNCNLLELWVRSTDADRLLATLPGQADGARELKEDDCQEKDVPGDNKTTQKEETKEVETWKDKTWGYADEEALKLYKTGRQKASQRDVARYVAARLAKDGFTGTQGPIDAESVRRHGLKGWKAPKPKE